MICKILDKLHPKADGTSYETQITFVQDRPGHDFRYAIDPTKIEKEIGWKSKGNFESHLTETVKFYL